MSNEFHLHQEYSLPIAVQSLLASESACIPAGVLWIPLCPQQKYLIKLLINDTCDLIVLNMHVKRLKIKIFIPCEKIFRNLWSVHMCETKTVKILLFLSSISAFLKNV